MNKLSELKNILSGSGLKQFNPYEFKPENKEGNRGETMKNETNKQIWHTNDNPTADYDIVFYDDIGVRRLGYYDKDLGFIEYGTGDIITAGEVERWAWLDDLVAATNGRK